MNDYQSLWNDTLDKLSGILSETTFSETFGEVKYVMKEENGVIYVLTPSTYIKSKINSLYIRQIAEILAELTTKKLKFKFVCEDEIKKEKPAPFSTISKDNCNRRFQSFRLFDRNKSCR